VRNLASPIDFGIGF